MQCVTQEKLMWFFSLSSEIKCALRLKAREPLHTIIHLYEAGFSLAKGRRNGSNNNGQRATIDVSGQRRRSLIMCAPTSENGVLTHIPLVGTLFDSLYRDIIPDIGCDVAGNVRPDNNIWMYISQSINQSFFLVSHQFITSVI